LRTRHVRHDDIQKDQVRLILDRHLNALRAAGGCQYVELSGLLQIEFDEKAEILLVIDDQYRFFNRGRSGLKDIHQLALLL
jgi:hypothetical protein